ncbi:MAG: metalloregulator ArsR/SmtB family transcription factor [Planctomycetota bacterium]
MKKNRKDKQLYKVKAQIIKALGHPLRLEIVDLLSDGELCVEEIAQTVGSERSNVSRHLSVLASVDLVKSRKQGLNIYYSLKVPCVIDFFCCVHKVLKEQISEKAKLLK